MSNRHYIFMSANGRCPLLMSAIGKFFHEKLIVVHSGPQLFDRLFGGARYSDCPLIGGFTVLRLNEQSLIIQKLVLKL